MENPAEWGKQREGAEEVGTGTGLKESLGILKLRTSVESEHA